MARFKKLLEIFFSFVNVLWGEFWPLWWNVVTQTVNVNTLPDLFVTAHYNMIRSLLCRQLWPGAQCFLGVRLFHCYEADIPSTLWWKWVFCSHVHLDSTGTQYILWVKVKDEGRCDLLNKSVVITQEHKSLQNCVLLILYILCAASVNMCEECSS